MSKKRLGISCGILGGSAIAYCIYKYYNQKLSESEDDYEEKEILEKTKTFPPVIFSHSKEKWVRDNVKAVIFCGRRFAGKNTGMQMVRKWSLLWEFNTRVLGLANVMGSSYVGGQWSAEDSQKAREDLKTVEGRNNYGSKMVDFCYENMHGFGSSNQVALITDVNHSDLVSFLETSFQESVIIYIDVDEEQCVKRSQSHVYPHHEEVDYSLLEQMADYVVDNNESAEVYATNLCRLFSTRLLPRFQGKRTIDKIPIPLVDGWYHDTFTVFAKQDYLMSLMYMCAASIRIAYGDVDLIVPVSSKSVALAAVIACILRADTVPIIYDETCSPPLHITWASGKSATGDFRIGIPSLSDKLKGNKAVLVDDILATGQRASSVTSLLITESYEVLGMCVVMSKGKVKQSFPVVSLMEVSE